MVHMHYNSALCVQLSKYDVIRPFFAQHYAMSAIVLHTAQIAVYCGQNSIILTPACTCRNTAYACMLLLSHCKCISYCSTEVT